jgi:hypothetical protein
MKAKHDQLAAFASYEGAGAVLYGFYDEPETLEEFWAKHAGCAFGVTYARTASGRAVSAECRVCPHASFYFDDEQRAALKKALASGVGLQSWAGLAGVLRTELIFRVDE